MLRASRVAAFAVVVFAIAGCRETARCPEERPRYEGGECVRAGDAGGDAGDGGELTDAGIDAGPCGGACAPTEFCVDDACVECRVSLADADCTALADPARALCVAGTCVQCRADAQCTTPGALECDETTGACVACTAANETTLCASTCDIRTGECSAVARGSVTTCLSCSSDLQCAADHACVAMTFEGVNRGNYCLRRSVGGSCVRPYGIPITDRPSVSSATPGDYCGIDETTTTCEAILAFSRDCSAALPCPAGGTCGIVGGIANSCTYGCTAMGQCVSPYACPVDTCQ